MQHCASKILTEHEWATTIVHGEAVHCMEQEGPRETEHTMVSENTGHGMATEEEG